MRYTEGVYGGFPTEDLAPVAFVPVEGILPYSELFCRREKACVAWAVSWSSSLPLLDS
ncbi:hypothetical protein PHAMO_400014 [Magnetospirillum molischianum DSM 120]|uniref:Uncharacterized protein n=1 Tax=Magnetospirillum molischianum DSM 120 TaxID=1150626 RepID=H8FW95_MAGML|nr:hypothetical protein PHAMO_400014 [Magnetospirillum molischianum DSM 120]